MRLGFRPGLWPTIATVVATLLFVRLGFWQLRRAHEAEAQKRAYLARVKEPPSPLTGGQWRPEALRFRRVVVRGRYEARYQILLDNQFNGPGVGYEVLTPLHLLGSRDRVLVNRGWVPLVGAKDGCCLQCRRPVGCNRLSVWRWCPEDISG